jgi:hypothetical protein
MIFVIFDDDVDLYFTATRVGPELGEQTASGWCCGNGPDATGWATSSGTVEGGGLNLRDLALCKTGMFAINSIRSPELPVAEPSAARCSITN